MRGERAASAARTLELRSAGGACAITIQPGALGTIGSVVRRSVGAAPSALVAMDSAVASSLGPGVCQSLEEAGFSVGLCTIDARESNKTLGSMEAIYEAMLSAGLERASPVVALGGGVVCDMAGFAAATFHRGVPVVMAPTTLLAMVDASIGGKNGVNFGITPEQEGSSPPQLLKNMIGTVWQPRAIVIDPEALATLPARHVRCGLAECTKIALLRDEALVPMIIAAPAQVAAQEWEPVSALIARCAAIKASIVEADEREDMAGAGGRAILNLGHTFAHAFELIDGLDLLHGEAVAIGLCAAASVARRTGRIDREREQRWRTIIAEVGLPTALPRQVRVATLLDLMRRDKKVHLGKLRLVLPSASGGAELVDDIDEGVIGVTLVEIGAA